jgi:FkbM family methyltransferase
MVNSMMKRAIQMTLRRFGYEINRTTTSIDPFAMQRQLITVSNPVILDIGAHIGSVARRYRQLFPLASIYCFEPFPQSFQELVKNLKGDTRVFCHRTAVSEKKGTAVLNANFSSATNSLLTTDKRGASFWGEGLLNTQSQVEVSTTTVDTICLETGISHVDILKMDVQGAEFSVLMGARDALSHERVSLVYTELITCPTYEGQHRLHEYLAYLDSFGYEFLDLFNPVRRHNQLIQADVVFVSASFKRGFEAQ